MQIWGVPLWMSLREIRYLKEEQLAKINEVRRAVVVNALQPHAAFRRASVQEVSRQ